jgi:uncharacterized protein YaaR (DUF327 family)
MYASDAFAYSSYRPAVGEYAVPSQSGSRASPEPHASAGGGGGFHNSELNALASSMRALGTTQHHGAHEPVAFTSQRALYDTRSSASAPSATYCETCELEEGGMTHNQRRTHEQHAYVGGSGHIAHHQQYNRASSALQHNHAAAQYQPSHSQSHSQYADQHRSLNSSSYDSGALSASVPHIHTHVHHSTSYSATPGATSVAHLQAPSSTAAVAPFGSSFSTSTGGGGAGVSGLGIPGSHLGGLVGGGGDESSLLYSSQPSRAVLSALRNLQDKLAELRVEKASLESRLARADADATAREHDLQRKHERALGEMRTAQVAFEAGYLAKLAESRAAEEATTKRLLHLEADARTHKEQTLHRDLDATSLREEVLRLKSAINEREIAGARLTGEHLAVIREREQEAAQRQTTEEALLRMREDYRTLASELQASHANADSLSVALASQEESRRSESNINEGLTSTITRAASEVTQKTHELLREREARQNLLQYKYLTREYIASLLNLTYELSIDVGMPVKKRNEILKHATDLLNGLKKQAWSLDYESSAAAGGGHRGERESKEDMNEAERREEQGLAASMSRMMHREQPFSGGDLFALASLSSPRKSGAGGAADGPGFASSTGTTIGGVHTSIDAQRYLLAGASSPAAIRVLHPDTIGTEAESSSSQDEDDDGEEDRQQRRMNLRIPSSPTIASRARSRSRPRATSRTGSNCHSLASGSDISLPYTIGRSTKQSFSVPVNVQEILSKQPAYYSRLAQKTMTTTARSKRSSVAGSGGDEDRLIVFPPAPAVTNASGMSSSLASAVPQPPISLAVHSQGLATVLQGLEREVEAFNADYIYHLDHSRRDDDEDKIALQSKLQSILKSIERKTKMIEVIKQHQATVMRSHGVRLHTASTASSRGSATSHKPKSSSGSSSRSTSLKRITPSSSSSSLAASSSSSTALRAQINTATMRKSATSRRSLGTSSGVSDRRLASSSTAVSPLRTNVPHFGYQSPNSQRLLEKKIKSMHMLSTFKQMFEGNGGEAMGEGLKRFGGD